MTWFTSFLYSQLLVTPPTPTKDFSGQTIIVTGSNTGLGHEAARHFSRLNAELVILAVRTLSKGESAKQSILETTKRASDSIEVWDLDLNSFASVKAFAARATKLPRIDGLLENAGIQSNHFQKVEGYESVITVNVLSTFLLAFLMAPKLQETAVRFETKPRLTIVASDVHFIADGAALDTSDIFSALNDELKAKEMGMPRYSISKLMEVLVVRQFAKVMREASPNSTHVIVNCLTPGLCISDFGRDAKGFQKIFFSALMAILARTTEVGSRTLVAAIEAGEESHGGYMADSIVVE